MLAERVRGNFRSIVAVPLKVTMTLFVLFLSCSLSGMLITGWACCFFLVVYIIADKLNTKSDLEIHTLGVEIPLIGFLIIIFFGLRSASEGNISPILMNLSNLILLFIFTYSLQVVKNLNRLLAALITFATLVAGYAISQHIMGSDILRPEMALEEIPWGTGLVKPCQGFFANHLVYAHSFIMIICLPWAALLLSRRSPWWQNFLYALSFVVILGSLFFSYGRGAWLALLVALPLMAFFASRKFFLVAAFFITLSAGLLYNLNTSVRESTQAVFSENSNKNEDRKNLWHINLEMFRDHPWVGVGYDQNEALSQSYYDKLEIKNAPVSNAHSNYVQLLATTGFLGFTFYTLIIIVFLLMTARLFSIIPTTHYWHRVFALGALGAQVAFHVGGLTHWNFGDIEVQLQLIFWLAVVGYMSQRYFLHIVPDDRSL